MSNQRYVLTNGSIIDVENGQVFEGSIEVENGYIKKVTYGKAKDTGAEFIDISGNFVIPGLIDMHCHMNESYSPQFVASGVTTVRNMGGRSMLQLKNLLEAPIDAPTPRVYTTERLIDGPPGLWGPTNEGNFVTDDTDEARREVRRQVAAGVNFIKVYGWLPKNVMEAVSDEANKCGLEVSCDLIHSTTVNALTAAKMGVSWFEHASGFIQAIYPGWHTQKEQKEWDKIDWDVPDTDKIYRVCEEMLQYNVKLCPTLIIQDQIDKFPDYWHLDNAVTRKLEGKDNLMEYWQGVSSDPEPYKKQLGIQNNWIKAITKIYFELGGTVVAGTDTPGGFYNYPGMGMHRELELLVETGLTELQAIQAATVTAAQSIHQHEIGVIKEGKIADLVILNKNPLEDIKHTKEIHSIIKGGKQYDQEAVLKHVRHLL